MLAIADLKQIVSAIEDHLVDEAFVVVHRFKRDVSGLEVEFKVRLRDRCHKGASGRARPSSARRSCADIFSFANDEIRKHEPDVAAALPRNRGGVGAVGLELLRCACFCQLEAADRTRMNTYSQPNSEIVVRQH